MAPKEVVTDAYPLAQQRIRPLQVHRARLKYKVHRRSHLPGNWAVCLIEDGPAIPQVLLWNVLFYTICSVVPSCRVNASNKIPPTGHQTDGGKMRNYCPTGNIYRHASTAQYRYAPTTVSMIMLLWNKLIVLEPYL